MDFINLDDIFTWRNNNEIITQVQRLGVIPENNEIKCWVDYCDGHFVMTPYAESIDGFRWRCNGHIRKSKKKPVACKKVASLRYKSFFYKSHLPIWKILGFVHMWVYKDTLLRMQNELRLAEHTLVDWANFCREVVFDAFITKATKIGGFGKIVEIDESKFGKRKYHRGHHVDGSWVFGGYERGTGRVFMVVVADRTQETLMDCIETFIEDGTMIYSDCWKGYSNLKDNKKYQHLQVNHSLHFKDPETEVCTNSIESSWRHAKAAGPYSHRKQEFLGGYLARYMFLKKCKEIKQDPLVIFLMLARDLYDPAELELSSNIEENDGDFLYR